MVRLRNRLLIAAMAAGAFGCAHGDGSHRNGDGYLHFSIFHCGECDDFPTPAYGPHYSMAPGSYSGPPTQSESSSRMGTPTSSNAPPANYEAVEPPPEERTTAPVSPPTEMGNTPPTPPPADTP